MAFTDNCDLFAALHEDAFNAVVTHVRRQRPSLFNYASLGVIANPGLLCRQIDVHPVVTQRNNPLMTRIDPLQIPGTNFAMELAVQVTEAKIDFHPGNVITLPPELGKLAPQRFAMALGVCLGLGCPRDFPVDRLIEPPKDKPDRDDKNPEPVPPRPLPVRSLMCFCLDVFAVGGVRIRFYNGKPYLEPFVERIEIVDIRPDELEAMLECYLEMMLKLGLIPKLRILLERAPLEIIKNVVSVVVKPTPISPAVPNNPAIEDDQLKAFINLEVI